MKVLKTFLEIFVLLPTTSFGLVNLQSGSWIWSEDFLDIHATYNSRSLSKGVFGFGWHSDLDIERHVERTHIKFYPDGTVNEISKGERILKFFYDHGRLVQVESSDGLIRSFSYDDLDNLYRIVDSENKRLIEIDYTEDDRVSRVSLPGFCETAYRFIESIDKDTVKLEAQVFRNCFHLGTQPKLKKVVSQYRRTGSEVLLDRISTGGLE